MYSKIIKNGEIVDGTGKKSFHGDIAIEQDKIVQIGNLKNAKAQEIIDASGKYVAPGFIDIQNHSDVYWTIFDNPRLDSLAAQGITTILIGNCGASLAPLLSRDALLSMRKWHNLEGINLNWLTFAEYAEELSKRSFGVNIASLVGYSTLRRGLLKDQVRSLSEEEQKIISKALVQSMDAGAFGLSSGLSYAHEIIIAATELPELSKIVKEKNGLVSLHLRSEGSELIESVAEALDLSKKTGVNLKISHLKVRGKNNWHLLPEVLNMIEDAYQKKGNVAFDVYPYDFVWQVLYTYLPKWAYEGGREAILHNVKNKLQRKKILAYLNSTDIDYSQIFIAGTSKSLGVSGKTIAEIAKRLNVSSEEALLSIVEKGGSDVLVFDHNLKEANVEELLEHSLSLIATDGAGFPIRKSGSIVHPRCFGTMPKYLSWALKKNIAIEQAVQKLTDIPAKKIGLSMRGRIAVDYFADLVVFDKSVKSDADYINPYQFPQGIEQVFVNGARIIQDGQMADKLSGRILRKS